MKAGKVVRNIFIGIGAVLLVLAILLFCDLTDQPRVFLRTLSAKRDAKEYCLEKYGEVPEITGSKPLYSGGFLFDRGSLIGIELEAWDSRIVVLEDDIVDNFQYARICAAFEEKYISDSTLGDCYELDNFVIVMNSGYSDCTDVFFDGDIDAFLEEVHPTVQSLVTYTGYPEKSERYPELLSAKLRELQVVPGEIDVRICIAAPTLDLPEMPNKHNSAQIMDFPQYEEYMELMACGRAVNGETDVYRLHFYAIDDHTAISDNNVDCWITSPRDFYFEQVDLSGDTTAYRGRYKYDNHAGENVLTVRSTGYRVGIREELHDYMLRLDREHYGITDSTVPLLVTDIITADNTRNTDWQGKRFYVSPGYEPYDCDGYSWYYLDEEYLYLYIHYLVYDFCDFGIDTPYCLTFYDGETV